MGMVRFWLARTGADALGIVARDHAHIFATLANIAAWPGMEINVVDPFSSNGYRFKGAARIMPKGARRSRASEPSIGTTISCALIAELPELGTYRIAETSGRAAGLVRINSPYDHE